MEYENVLLIWDPYDNGLEFFIIQANEKERNMLGSINGLYGNSDEMTDDQKEAFNRISQAICEDEKCCLDKEWACRWVKNKVDSPIKETIYCVYYCGYMP